MIRRIRRTTALSFGPPEWPPADALDDAYFRLQPSGQSTVTAEVLVSAMQIALVDLDQCCQPTAVQKK